MFDQWLKLPAHYYLRITALVILVVGIAVSNVLMSIGAIWIISNWLIEADFKNYKERLKHSPELCLILGILLYLVISLAWSDDFWFGFKDIRIKLPMLAIPLALGSGKPLESKVFYFILYIFIGIVLYTSVYNYVWYNFIFDFPTDVRMMSKFISQIRFATLVDLAFFTCVYLWFEKRLKWFIAAPLMVWFLFYTYKSQVLNGYILFAILLLYTLFYSIRQIKSAKIKWLTLALAIALVLASTVHVLNAAKTYQGIDKPVFSELDFYTENGNPYFHDTSFVQTENGHHIWLYVCQEELRPEWNKRSAIAYDSTDKKGQPMYGTLMRYMTSKNLRKDSAGLAQLSDEEIRKIEKGTTSVEMNSGLETKIHSFLFELDMYRGGADPNGFSLLQRLEHLRIARSVLAEHWLFGVGIGDMGTVFDEHYEKNNSKLLPENRHRAHNQFISIWIGLGLIGFVAMVLVFVVPLWKNRKTGDYFLVVSMLALIVSFMFEDMLETQAGATIFALFYAIAVFRGNDAPR
jgi:hypothetical protein